LTPPAASPGPGEDVPAGAAAEAGAPAAGEGPADPAAAERLQQAARALQRPLGAAQVDKLWAYLALLRRWNATYNLTAVRDPQAMVTQHLVDCLAAAAALERRGGFGAGSRILDAGSGGGLPGVVLAALHPEWQVTCVDSVGKKVAFVRQAAGTLRLANLAAVQARLGPWRGGPFDLVTARAFASLADLARWTEPVLAEGGCWMAMKGQVPEAEIAALPREIEVFHVEPLAVPGLDAERCLVWMRRRSHTEPA
jgi:16S rRNA (guanine527-N7)-methyltransferase